MIRSNLGREGSVGTRGALSTSGALGKQGKTKPTRTGLMLVFMLLNLTLYGLMHFSVLLALRAWAPSSAATTVIIALWVCSVLALFIAKIHHDPFTNLLYRIGVTWIGIVFLLFIVLFPATLLTLAVGGTLTPLIMIPAGIIIMLSAWLAVATRIKYLDIAVAKLPKKLDGMRIAHLTDLHIGEIYGPAFLRRIVRMTNEQDPDLIVITGDVFDGGGKPYAHMVEPLRDLRAKHGVYYVRGNHDVYEGVEETDRQLAACGITILDDALAKVNGLALVGISYPTDLKDDKRIILKKLAFEVQHKHKAVPHILLRHEPKDPHLAADLGFDLMLSGHTHNGQLWPMNYLVSLAYPFRIGRHRIKQMTLSIGPGIGTWGPPLRLGSRSEITLIKLRHLG